MCVIIMILHKTISKNPQIDFPWVLVLNDTRIVNKRSVHA